MSSHVEAIARAKEQASTIEMWKRQPILFARLSQVICEMDLSGIAPYDILEYFGEGEHQFRVLLGTKMSPQLIGELRYHNRQEIGLHFVGYLLDSPIGNYYRNQLETIAISRKIPFFKAD